MMKIALRPILFSLTLYATLAAGPVGAQPYKGYGAVTQGAASSPDGYSTYRVTSLSDSGPGTLRDALSEGKRHIVFDVGGTITLQRPLYVRWAYTTIAGETAPSPGITIDHPSGDIGTHIASVDSYSGEVHDVIVRYLRNTGRGGHPRNDADIWGIDGNVLPVYRVILDHLTGIAAEDGVFDIWGNVSDVTISNCWIKDTSMAVAVGGRGTRRRLTFYQNLFSGNDGRQVRLAGDTVDVDYINNIVYGWGAGQLVGGLGLELETVDVLPAADRVNVEANIFHRVVSNPYGDDDRAIEFDRNGNQRSVHFANNALPPGERDAVSTSPRHERPRRAQVPIVSTDALPADLLPAVGTLYRTQSERQLIDRIFEEVSPPDSPNPPQAQAGGVDPGIVARLLEELGVIPDPFGPLTQGALSSPTGYDIFHVTSLADSGRGTLRHGLSTGGRVVVFDVAGTIALEDDLTIRWPYITIDGGSAPDPGITILQSERSRLRIAGDPRAGPSHDIIVRRVRMAGQATGDAAGGTLFQIDGRGAAVFNILLDQFMPVDATGDVFNIWATNTDRAPRASPPVSAPVRP